MPDFNVTPIADGGIGAEVTDAVTIDYAMAFKPETTEAVMSYHARQIVAALQREVHFRWEQRTSLSFRLQDLRHELVRAGVDEMSPLYERFHSLTSTAEGWMHPGTLSEAAGAHLGSLKRRIAELEEKLIPVEALGRDDGDAPTAADALYRTLLRDLALQGNNNPTFEEVVNRYYIGRQDTRFSFTGELDDTPAAEEPWTRDNEATHACILLIDGQDTGFVGEDWDPQLARIAAWTDEECRAVEDYCRAVHIQASDNDDYPIPTKPAVLGVEMGAEA